MARKSTKIWRGFLYEPVNGRKPGPVEFLRTEWQQLIKYGSSQRMPDGSLNVFDAKFRLIAEVYDKD